MKRSWKKLTALFLAVALLTAIVVVPACAASGRSSLYLSAYRAWLTPKSGAKINVTIDVQAVGDMDSVGALDVTIYESSDGGSTWHDDAIYYSALFPELLDHDTYWYYETPLSYQGTAGNKYFAVVTVYAGDSTGSDSREYTTPTVTARS